MRYNYRYTSHVSKSEVDYVLSFSATYEEPRQTRIRAVILPAIMENIIPTDIHDLSSVELTEGKSLTII